MPQMNKKLNQDQTEHQCMLAIRWHDKHDVRMLTTVHINETVPMHKLDRITGEAIVKPQCIEGYNQNMCTVDRTELLSSSIETV